MDTNYFDLIISSPYKIFTFLSSLLLRSTITMVGLSCISAHASHLLLLEIAIQLIPRDPGKH